eukprot:PhF_6_TR22345/c0_g1_i1/m.31639/K17800/LETM1, MDM38; LETM1 and EF-hand domain-containing protein 1, mitochondrial
MKPTNQSWWDWLKAGAIFYWEGTKQYKANTVYAFFLLRKRATGHTLAWPHIRHLHESRSDAVRLIPFSFFVLVPFAELLLPFALYAFPTLLPSTYEDDHHKQIRYNKINTKRIKWSQELDKTHPDLRDMVKVNPKPVDDFDEPVLKRLSTTQLYKMAVFTGRWHLGPYTPHNILEISIRRYVRILHRDDLLLLQWGVERLSRIEVRDACMTRCIPNNKERLADWVKRSGSDPSLVTTTVLFVEAVSTFADPDTLKLAEANSNKHD